MLLVCLSDYFCLCRLSWRLLSLNNLCWPCLRSTLAWLYVLQLSRCYPSIGGDGVLAMLPPPPMQASPPTRDSYAAVDLLLPLLRCNMVLSLASLSRSLTYAHTRQHVSFKPIAANPMLCRRSCR